MRGLIEHHLGMRIDGVICRFENGGMTEEEFSAYTKYGLPKGWVAWHAGTVNADALRRVPVAHLEDGRPVPRRWIEARLREMVTAGLVDECAAGFGLSPETIRAGLIPPKRRRHRVSDEEAYGVWCEMSDSERFGAEC